MSLHPSDSEPSETPPPDGPNGGSTPPPETATGESAGAPAAPSEAEEELPEWEPLTPELVEDEAIRGDFVIRWAVVGLAVLLGCSQIAETKSLIHIRSGEYLATHGILPPARDYLAYTRSELPWLNYSWFFDLLAAGVHALGGGIALSLFQAVAAAVIFGLLVHTCRPGIRTWWGSICAVFALLACFRQFTIQPELVTLLGTATLMWLLVRTQEGTDSRGQWAIVPLIWVWSQLDSRAFLGWGLLLLYGLGEWLDTVRGRASELDAGRRKSLWMIVGASVVVVAVHPFGWQAWTSPLTLYGVEYPAWQAAYPIPTRNELGVWPIWDARFLPSLNHEGLAGLYLVAAAPIAMLLNMRRLRLSHVCLYLGINAAAALATHELAAASLVNCVLATLNAQEWFLARYGQTYSIQWSFLLFSRGGRAMTVFGLFAVGYLIVSGRIDGPNGKRTGLGFDEQLQSLMTGYELAEADSYDDRPFPFVIRQGDLLIWAGKRSFIDSRLELFYPGGDNSLFHLHDKTRNALRRRNERLPGSGDRSHWRQLFDDYRITHVAARMVGLNLAPNYSTFDDLLRSIDWKLTNLTSAVAIFYRNDVRQDRELKEYVAGHQLDLVPLAFQDETTPVADPQVWPARTTAYQRALSLPRRNVPGEIATANHYLNYAAQDILRPAQRMAAVHLALREARAGLRKDPNSVDGYRTLGSAYSLLDQLENLELRRHGIELPHLLRYYQIVAAYQNALLLEPDDPFLNHELAGFYYKVQKWDLALRHLQEAARLRPAFGTAVPEEVEKQFAELDKLAEQLETRVAAIQAEIDQQGERGASSLNAALLAFQNGAVLAAIATLEEDKIALAQSPQAQVMLSGWLIEAGRVEEADQFLRALEQHPGIELLPGWRENSIHTAWAQGDYARVAQFYEGAVASSEHRRVSALLATGPLASTSIELYPGGHILAVQDVQGLRPNELGSNLIGLALCRMEQGDLPGAQLALKTALDDASESVYRPLMLAYWYCLTGERLEIEPPSDWIPITNDLFVEESE